MLARMFLAEFGGLLLIGACLGAGQVFRAHRAEVLRPRTVEDRVLLVAALAIAGRYAAGMRETRGRMLPELGAVWLWGLGGACLFYLMMRARRLSKRARAEMA